MNKQEAAQAKTERMYFISYVNNWIFKYTENYYISPKIQETGVFEIGDKANDK